MKAGRLDMSSNTAQRGRRGASPGGMVSGHRLLACASLLVLLSGCATQAFKAPVEDRNAGSKPVAASVTPSAPAAASASAPAVATDASPGKTLPGAENAGKPGYYSIRPGDTLIRIGLDNGQNWRDVARWNNIDNPNLIEVGQVLRVAPPGADVNGVTVKPVTAAGRVEPKPLDGRAPVVVPAAAGASSSTPTSAPTSAPTSTSAAVPAPPAAAREPDEDLNWAWPAAGPVATGFDEAKSKGLAITGKAGDPVLAAADGRVVYAGSGLRGYGNLVIVKHNTTYLTAYAHNQTLLVKEDQAVRRGQKIAEMGNSDADRVQLHFEIRRQGKPIDPARLLPPR
jgi:lipoprotein NlpD